jgi:S-adenosylmethionine-diacylgycerolhomoserine-N-methlytransferase
MKLVAFRSRWRTLPGAQSGDAQAARFDGLRGPQSSTGVSAHARMPRGREELLNILSPSPASRIVELAAGAGAMVDLWGARLSQFAALELVEARPAMIERAEKRARRHPCVRVVRADASAYRPPWQADYVYLSYALVTIPDWVRRLNNALAMLRPGGKIGIVDYCIANGGHGRMVASPSAIRNWLSSRCLRHDRAFLSSSYLDALNLLTEPEYLHEDSVSLPYLPLLKVPYFVFVGIKPVRPRLELVADLWKRSSTPS